MAVDVLHHHDGVIHQDADGEDKGKEGHPIEGKAPGPAGKQGQRQGDDDGDAHHQRLTPPHAHQYQQHHRRGGKNQLADEGVGFGLGGDAIVTGHRHLDAARDEPVLETLDPGFHPLGHLYRVLPGLFAYGQGYCRIALLPLPHPAALHRGLLPKGHLGHLTEVDRFAIVQPHYQLAGLLLALQELAHLHLDLPVVLHHGLLAARLVGGGEPLVQLAPADAVGAEGRRIQHHPQHGALAAQAVDVAGAGQSLELGLQLVGDPGQLGGPQLLAPERQADDGHIVDPPGFDQRLADAKPLGQPVPVRVELVVEIDDGLLAAHPHLEHHHQQGAVRAREGVEGVYPLDLGNNLFGGSGDEGFDLRRAGPREGDIDVGEGDIDLRLLLLGGYQHRKQAEQEPHQRQQRGDGRALKQRRQPAGRPQFVLAVVSVVTHGPPPAGAPSHPEPPDHRSGRPPGSRTAQPGNGRPAPASAPSHPPPSGRDR